MKSTTLILALLAPVWLNASAAAYFQAGPSGSKFPAYMHTENTSGLEPVKSIYKNGYTTDGWTVDAADGTSYAFVAPSRTDDGEPLNSRLTTDPFTVESTDAWLRWNARSILPGFPEEYEVVVNNLTDGTTATLAAVSAESHDWATRLAPLTEFAGKEISISFICRSAGKYMLAVKNIYAGVFDQSEWVISHKPARYAAADDGASAIGEITNVGAPMENASIVCRIGETDQESEIAGTWNTGVTVPYEFEIPTALNESTDYSIGIKDADGNFVELTTSSVFSSYFVRNLLVDEGTGMWCNNCPGGTLTLDKIQAQYGGNAIILSCHTKDPFALDNYWSELKFYAVPYMMLNRSRATVGSDTRNFDKAYLTPTIAEVAMPEYIAVGDDRTVSVELSTRFADATDNSDGRYRIGYTLSADIYSPDSLYYQENNLTFARYEQYYFLPSIVPPTLARFDNVVISEDYAFTGIEGSIPTSIEAMTPYPTSLSLTLPELADIAQEVRLVAYIIDTTSGEIVNASSSVIGSSNGVGQIYGCADDNRLAIAILRDGRCVVDGIGDDEQVTVTVTDSSGRILDRISATRASLADRALRLPSGIAIITATSSGKTAATKHISIK